jgi:hypothetical protein
MHFRIYAIIQLDKEKSVINDIDVSKLWNACQMTKHAKDNFAH